MGFTGLTKTQMNDKGNFLKQFIQNRRYYKKLLGFDGEFPHGECFQPPAKKN